MKKQISAEILAYNPVIMNECVDCEFIWGDLDDSSSAHLQHILDHLDGENIIEYVNVSAWIAKIQRQYRDQVHFRVIDALSLEGLAKTSQYGVQTFPSVVINRQDVFDARSLNMASIEIEDLVQTAEVS